MATFIKTTYTKQRGNGHILLIGFKLRINLGAKSYKGF